MKLCSPNRRKATPLTRLRRAAGRADQVAVRLVPCMKMPGVIPCYHRTITLTIGGFMYRSTSTIVALLFTSGLISGCQFPPHRDDQRSRLAEAEPNEGCLASFITPAGNLKGSGIEIPLGKWASGPIKIGSVTYDHSDAQKLSEAAQRAEQSRLTFCRATSPTVLTTLLQQDRKEVILLAISSNEKIQLSVNNFVSVVINAKTVEEGTAAAAAMKQVVEGEQKKVVEKAPAAGPEKQANGSPYNPQSWALALTLMQAESADSLTKLSDKVDALTQKFDSGRPRGEIRVLGFNDQGVALPATDRQRLYNQFQVALSNIPESQRPVVLVVGYASKSGVYLKNNDLSLRRAQAVLSYLQEQKFSRGYEGRIMSSGVDDSAYAQRVDLFVMGS